MVVVRLLKDVGERLYPGADAHYIGPSGELYVSGIDLNVVIAPGQWLSAERHEIGADAPETRVTIGDR